MGSKLNLLIIVFSIITVLMGFSVINAVIDNNTDINNNESDNIQYKGNLDTDKVRSELYTIINRNRGDKNIETLDRNRDLEDVAGYKSINMKMNSELSRDTEEELNLRFRRFNVKCNNAYQSIMTTEYKEEINVTYSDSTQLYKSESQLAEGIYQDLVVSQDNNYFNNKNMTEYGIGVSVNDKGKVYVSTIVCS